MLIFGNSEIVIHIFDMIIIKMTLQMILAIVQIQRYLSECMCATNIGTNVCSDTRKITDKICTISLSMYNVGTLEMAMQMGM